MIKEWKDLLCKGKLIGRKYILTASLSIRRFFQYPKKKHIFFISMNSLANSFSDSIPRIRKKKNPEFLSLCLTSKMLFVIDI